MMKRAFYRQAEPPLTENDSDDDSMTNLPPTINRRDDFLEPLWNWKTRTKQSAVEVERMKKADLYMVHSVEFELTIGDTLVFVDLPNEPSGTRKLLDCDSIAYRSLPFRVHSEKLRATGSAVFEEMLGPTNQFRVQRRRKLVNKLPKGVKYVLDLTPPTEGDDLVFQLTEVSLTPGIMRWWTSYLMHDVDRALVVGHDDVCSCKRASGREGNQSDDYESSGSQHTLGTSVPLPPAPSAILLLKQQGDDALYKTPEFRKIPDYCPVRHRNAIVRLLVHIEGKGIALDSAPRVWTLLGVAKILECTAAVRNEIAQWLMAQGNSEFIEVLPEEAIQMGYALQLSDVTRSAFRILVNEMALAEASSSSSSDGPNVKRRTAIFGRRTGDVSDELSNLIEHAARALEGRMVHVNHQFNAVLDYWFVPQWMKLRRLEAAIARSCPDASNPGGSANLPFGACAGLVRKLVLDISDCVRNALQGSLNQSNSPAYYFEGIDKDRATYVLPSDFVEFADIYKEFNRIQRLMCPFIYKELHKKIMNPLSTTKAKGDKPPILPLITDTLHNLEHELGYLVRHFPSQFLDNDWAEFLDRTLEENGSVSHTWRAPLIDFSTMDREIGFAFLPLSNSWLRHDIEPMCNLTRHMLLTLDTNEMKYLPLWAGGLNDGTGGVFEEPIPSTDMGPNGPGPAFHTGQTLPSAPPSISDSLMDEIVAMNVRGSDTDASVDVHDSVSTVYRSDRVIADDVSIATESFGTADNEYAAARFAVPSDHQQMGQTLDDMVDSGTERGDDDYTMENDTPQMSDGESDDLVDVEKELQHE